MRILLLTKKNRNLYNSRLHYDFIMKLKAFGEVIPIELVKDHKDKPYIDAKSLYCKYKPDIVVMHFHAPNLYQYLDKISCAKVMIVVDYYKAVIKNYFEWYESNKFDLIIQRGVYDTLVYNKVPMVWLPFCANDEEFYPNFVMWNFRKEKVCFSGNWESPIYTWRRRALQQLEGANLLLWPRKLLLGKAYCKFLRGVMAGFCSAELKSPHARVFELMASGTVLLTHPFQRSEELFGKEKIYVECDETSSNLVEKANRILNDSIRAIEIAKRAYDVFLQKHTERHRLHEFYTHLSNLLSGKDIERKWGL